ncbi:hypothetical protein [Thioalkalivibrio sp. XN8]|uniref:HvfA family oxazolone/thioamide-modified RiPP metallophore n=1 Tax=Thioalkalivibrio sp. XN8 TaxID=2712863 RepID=UPI0013EC8271|nr:hypothetical protein [Thioalkalivibrio sp. XN8]NGP53121.1 hypothetical protein [Thioalkalivibrio sp. XN8]
MKKIHQNTSVILGAALLSSLGISAAHAAEASPAALFSAVDLDRGYMLSVGEGKCGEGKCGGDQKEKGEDKKGAEGKCGEGKCGAADKEGGQQDGKKKGAEGKCGEGKCGGVA